MKCIAGLCAVRQRTGKLPDKSVSGSTAGNNVMNANRGNTKCSCKRGLGFSLSIPVSKFGQLFKSKCAMPMGFPGCRSFGSSILHILTPISEPEMCRINAIRVISTRAIVTHPKSFWDWTLVQHKRGNVGGKGVPFLILSFANGAISRLVKRAIEKPARISLSDFGPKPVGECLRKTQRNHPIRCLMSNGNSADNFFLSGVGCGAKFLEPIYLLVREWCVQLSRSAQHFYVKSVSASKVIGIYASRILLWANRNQYFPVSNLAIVNQPSGTSCRYVSAVSPPACSESTKSVLPLGSLPWPAVLGLMYLIQKAFHSRNRQSFCRQKWVWVRRRGKELTSKVAFCSETVILFLHSTCSFKGFYCASPRPYKARGHFLYSFLIDLLGQINCWLDRVRLAVDLLLGPLPLKNYATR